MQSGKQEEDLEEVAKAKNEALMNNEEAGPMEEVSESDEPTLVTHTAGLLALPDDPLVVILSHLPLQQIARCARVCKRMNAVCGVRVE